MKTTTSEKNILDEVSGILDIAEEKNLKEIPKWQKEKTKKWQSIPDLWDSFRPLYACIIGVPEREERMNRNTISKNNVQKCPKFGENCKITSPSSPTNWSTKKQEENDPKSHHNEAAQSVLLAKLSKVWQDGK